MGECVNGEQARVPKEERDRVPFKFLRVVGCLAVPRGNAFANSSGVRGGGATMTSKKPSESQLLVGSWLETEFLHYILSFALSPAPIHSILRATTTKE